MKTPIEQIKAGLAGEKAEDWNPGDDELAAGVFAKNLRKSLEAVGFEVFLDDVQGNEDEAMVVRVAKQKAPYVRVAVTGATRGEVKVTTVLWKAGGAGRPEKARSAKALGDWRRLTGPITSWLRKALEEGVDVDTLSEAIVGDGETQVSVQDTVADGVRLREANGSQHCDSCRWYEGGGCIALSAPVNGATQVCDLWNGGDSVSVPELDDEEAALFAKGVAKTGKMSLKVTGWALTDAGMHLLMEDSAVPPHRFAVMVDEMLDLAVVEFGYSDDEIDELIEAGRQAGDD